MQPNLQTLQATIHCPYKSWQISKEALVGEDNAPELPSNPTTDAKISIAAWYIFHPDLIPTESVKKVISKYEEKAQTLLSKTESIINGTEPPSFYKISHCAECQFKNSCYQKLKERDCISLLAGMTPKVVAKYHSKGIRTITQLAHLFRPRRRSRMIHTTGRFYYELKALAIRDQKTFILQSPDIANTPTLIFIDFEGIPDQDFYYLLGGIIVTGGEIKEQFSFWSEDKEQTINNFSKLFTLLSQYPDTPIYHYGSYESKAFKDTVKKTGGKFKEEWASLEKRMVNLLAYFRTHVYPPTYSNGLKEIAGFLGFKWTDVNADGYTSISWHKQWEETGLQFWKDKLLEYNHDDCKALHVVHQWFCQLAEGADQENVQHVTKMKRHSPYHLHSNEEFGEDYEYISKASYFNYQRDKIYWRNGVKKQSPKSKSLSRKPKRTSKGLMVWQPKKIHEVIVAPPLAKCLDCGENKLRQGVKLSKVIQTDLKFTRTGVKQHVIEYQTGYADCLSCGSRNNNRNLRMMHYGDNLFAFAVNCYVNYRMSNEMISRLIQEEFGIWIAPTYLVMNKYRWWDKRWQPEAEYVKEIVLKSPVIHIDETQIKLSGESGYVWVFATTHSVFYHYSQFRSANFVAELLTGYEGVVISDFFPGYETLNVKRQKCLIHLIRDLNDDLFKNPFDEEYKVIVAGFSKLLRTIIQTIDRYGLQKSHLQRHVKDTKCFFSEYIDSAHKSELSVKYAKRLTKHWDELWTFLHYDNVPWNNNNAEAAIKAFAQHRRGVKGVMHPRGLREYLQMLSVAQTCRYRNISFLGLLRNKCGIWENIPPDALPGFLPFKQARLYVRKFNFERKREWEIWKKQGKRPPFIPYNPDKTYKNKGWKGWHDWLGFGFLPFPKARTYVRKLKIKSLRKYTAWSTSGKRPKTIPADPAKIYKHTGWIDINDWLGTINKKKNWLSYNEAKAFIQACGIKTQHEYFQWRKSGNKPHNIPSAPESTYREFEGWGKFLGTGRIANQKRGFWDYDLAKAFFKILRVHSVKHYSELYESGMIPPEIPRRPDAYYKKIGSWISFSDLWGME